eukprot:446455_1
MSKSSKRTLCIKHNLFGSTTFAFILLPAVLIIPVLLCGFRASLKLTSKSLKTMYWITSFFLLLAAIIRPFLYYFNYFECSNINDKAISAELSVAAYNMSLICICILYTIRIHLSFHSSQYSLFKCTLAILTFTILCQIFLAFFTSYFNHFAWMSRINTSLDDALYYAKLSLITLLIFRAINAIYNISLFILFINKIYQIIQNLKQQTVQSTIVYALCLLMALVSTLSVNIFGIFRMKVIVDSNELYLSHQTSIEWDIFINALSIYFQFDSVNIYLLNKFMCCKCCQKNVMNEIDHVQNTCIQIETNSKDRTTAYTTTNYTTIMTTDTDPRPDLDTTTTTTTT